MRHNHITRDIKGIPGDCPACDEYHKNQIIPFLAGGLDEVGIQKWLGWRIEEGYNWIEIYNDAETLKESVAD